MQHILVHRERHERAGQSEREHHRHDCTADEAEQQKSEHVEDDETDLQQDRAPAHRLVDVEAADRRLGTPVGRIAQDFKCVFVYADPDRQIDQPAERQQREQAPESEQADRHQRIAAQRVEADLAQPIPERNDVFGYFRRRVGRIHGCNPAWGWASLRSGPGNPCRG